MPVRRIDAIDTDGHVNSVPQGQNCYFTKLYKIAMYTFTNGSLFLFTRMIFTKVY